MDGSVAQPGHLHPIVFVLRHFHTGTPLCTHQPANTIRIPVGGARFPIGVCQTALHITKDCLQLILHLLSCVVPSYHQGQWPTSSMVGFKGHNIFWTFPKCQSYRSSTLRARRCLLWLHTYTMRCWWITSGSGIIFIINYYFVLIMGHNEDKAMQLS